MFLTKPSIESDSQLKKRFMKHQIDWIMAEQPIHKQAKQAIALAEKSIRIGWTYADGFKNVRKRILYANRDYLFATKDYPSALEYVSQCYKFAEIFDLTRSIVSHGEESINVARLDERGRPSAFTEDVKVGVIKFDNGSRIIAFSANPQAMAVYGGDVGLDEFAKHPNARLLWETAQGRITLQGDLAIWSAHDGEDTLFNEFAQEARAACTSGLLVPAGPGYWRLPDPAGKAPQDAAASSTLSAGGEGQGEVASEIENQNSRFKNPRPTPPLQHSSTPTTPSSSPWNLYFRVTMEDAINFGLVETMNRAKGTKFSRQSFLADCRARARDDGLFQQAYMCNPLGAATNHIVDWSSIEQCRFDYEIIRVHLEHAQIIELFGAFSSAGASSREYDIEQFIHKKFLKLFQNKSTYRMGFDVAASGQGDLAVLYIDEVKGSDLWLRGLFTCRTEDWNFLKTCLFYFLKMLRNVQAAGDETGLGRQICWEASEYFSSIFTRVNFASQKHDLGFALMNQLSTARKRFPRDHQDIAADFFALRKVFQGNRWIFMEGNNSSNPASHCDIAWAGALATHAHTVRRATLCARLG